MSSILTLLAVEMVIEESTRVELDRRTRTLEDHRKLEGQARCESIKSKTSTASDTKTKFYRNQHLLEKTRTLILFICKVNFPDKFIINFSVADRDWIWKSKQQTWEQLRKYLGFEENIHLPMLYDYVRNFRFSMSESEATQQRDDVLVTIIVYAIFEKQCDAKR